MFVLGFVGLPVVYCLLIVLVLRCAFMRFDDVACSGWFWLLDAVLVWV